MAKELRISGRLPLPDALFAQAEVMAEVAAAVGVLKDALTKLHAGATVEAALVTPRVVSDDAPKPRRERKAS